MQKGKTESDSKSAVKENKTLDIRNRRYEDDFHGMVRHLSSSKKKDTFVYQLETELKFDSVSQQQKSIPVSNHQELENKKQMKKVQSVKQQKLSAYHFIKRNKTGETIKQEKSKTVVDSSRKLKSQSTSFAHKNKLQLIQKVMMKYLN